jgi:hypothetical protein
LRNNSIQSQLNYVSANPIVYKIDYLPKNPGPNDSIYVYASGFDNGSISNMQIQFHPGLLTVVYFYNMKFKPLPSTKVYDADRWIGVIPPLGNSGFGRFKIEATDNEGNKVIYPRNEFIELKANSNVNASFIVVNEFMADNVNTIKDPAGENDDWVEIYNPTQNSILLTGMYMTDKKDNKTKWKITQPNLMLEPNKHIIVWCDENHNDNQPGLHSNFKLSKGGEFIGIVASDGTTWIDSVTFGAQIADASFGRYPDGSIYWILMHPTPGSANIATDLDEEKIPTEFKISAYPNPFNPSTTIVYSLPTYSDVEVSIYDLLGNEIWSVTERNKSAGINKIVWNGKNNFGMQVGSGIYFCRISTKEYSSLIKLVLMK